VNGNNGGRANAITFSGGTGSLELQQGWSILGNVVGATAAGSTNTLIFGGAGTNVSGGQLLPQ
jgi:fibronectin-binding autotransporter adhesin